MPKNTFAPKYSLSAFRADVTSQARTLFTILLIPLWTQGCDVNIPGQTASSSSSPAAGASAATAPSGNAPGNADSPSDSVDGEEQAFLGEINCYREAEKLPTLSISVGLQKAARWKSKSMATHQNLDHDDPDGRSFATRLAAYYPYKTIAENIAMGHADAKQTFEQWKNSPGHDKNMRGAAYRAIGIARAHDGQSANGWYWTTDFGNAVEADQ